MDESYQVEFYFLSPGCTQVDEQGVEVLDDLGKEQVTDACSVLEKIKDWDGWILFDPLSRVAFNTARVVIQCTNRPGIAKTGGSLNAEMSDEALWAWMARTVADGHKRVFVAVLPYATASQLLDTDEELLVYEAAIVHYSCVFKQGELVIEASETLTSF